MLLRDKSNRLIQIENYKILKPLGRGGFGTVFHVEDIATKKNYALKILHSSLNISRITTQLSILKLLNQSPYFLRTYFSKRASNLFFLVLDFAQEGNLKAIVKDSFFNESMACRVLLELLESMKYLKSNGIIHGDIKAENIVKMNGSYFLCDWDVATHSDRAEVIHIKNDKDFVAPEIYRGFITSASDLYSLGCLLYFMLTKEHIYAFTKETNFSKKMFAHLYMAPKPHAMISENMYELICRMTEKNPYERIGLEELEEIVKNPEKKLLKRTREFLKDTYKTKFDRYYFMACNDVVYAQNILGLLFQEGKEVRKNEQEALLWYKKACEKNFAKAEFNYATLRLKSAKTEDDFQEIKEYLSKATEQGHERSSYALGKMYECGWGAKIDLQEAKKFYEHSALHGYKPAYLKLQELHAMEKGKSVIE